MPRLRLTATIAVVALVIAAGWLAKPSAQKRTTSTVAPFQTALTIVVPANDSYAVGTINFQVPAGKRLNLRYLTLERTAVPPVRVEIETTVDGVAVTHTVLNGDTADHLINLWADDGGSVVVRIFQNTNVTPNDVTWHGSLTGELF